MSEIHEDRFFFNSLKNILCNGFKDIADQQAESCISDLCSRDTVDFNPFNIPPTNVKTLKSKVFMRDSLT